MKAYAQALDLKDNPAAIVEYEKHHRAVWPEVVEGLRRIGIRRMKIFRTGTRLFMYYEAPDDFNPARDYQSYAADPRTREWDDLMCRYQQRVPSAGPHDWWTPMEEIFDLESSNADN